jgi:hypothetical protein
MCRTLYTVAALDGQTRGHLTDCLLEVVDDERHACVLLVGHNKVTGWAGWVVASMVGWAVALMVGWVGGGEQSRWLGFLVVGGAS